MLRKEQVILSRDKDAGRIRKAVQDKGAGSNSLGDKKKMTVNHRSKELKLCESGRKPPGKKRKLCDRSVSKGRLRKVRLGVGWISRSNFVQAVIDLCSGCLTEGAEASRVEVLAEGADVINVKVYARAVKEVWAEGGEASRAEVLWAEAARAFRAEV